ncbi:1543_t:CDS:1, partial [Dentiscutata erythropus]
MHKHEASELEKSEPVKIEKAQASELEKSEPVKIEEKSEELVKIETPKL